MKIIIDAYLDNNLGDDLMVKLLLKAFPQHSFYLYTNSATISNTFKNIKNLTIRNLNQRNADILFADMYITIGGSRFQLVHRTSKIKRIFRIRRLRKYKRKKILLVNLGSNFGPYSDNFGKKLTEWEMRTNSLITVRDSESYQLLKKFHKVDNFHFADDIVYNLNSIYSIKNKKRNGLGISVYRSTNYPENSYSNYKFLAALSDNYIRKTGKQVKLFAFDTERENDLAAAHHIYNMSKEKSNIIIVPYLGDEQLFLSQFEACERMVAIRFHSAILSDIFKIPFLPIVYSNKMRNLLEDRNFSGLVINVKELNMNLVVDDVVNTIIDGKNLFTNFTNRDKNETIHFEELEKLLYKA